MMRIASILLVVTLLSTCVISGTFAKYVTKAEGTDSARVAKWGVLVSVEGGTFDTKYTTHDDAYEGEFSVIAEDETKVVAPGTSSADVEDTLKATITGKPEVAARYTIEAKDFQDVVLPAGTYTDYTKLGADGEYSEEFTLAKDYAPVKWDITISKGSKTVTMTELLYDNLPDNYRQVAENYGLSKDGCSLTDAITIIQKVAGNEAYKQVVEAGLQSVVSGGSNFQLSADNGDIKLSYDFDPNKDMGFTFELTWAWAFEQEDVELYDKADTLLGNIAAGVAEAPEGASVKLGATFIATATQID